MKNVFKIDEKINEKDGTIRVARLCVENALEYFKGNHDVCEWATVEYKYDLDEQKQVIANYFGINVETIEIIFMDLLVL